MPLNGRIHLTDQRLHLCVRFLDEWIQDASRLLAAAVGVEIHVAEGLHGAQVEDDAGLSVGMGDIDEDSITGGETDVGVVFSLEPWAGWVQS